MIPLPIFSISSLADTLNSIRFPSRDHLGIGTNITTYGRRGKMRYIKRGTDALSPISRNSLMALRPAFSVIRIITG
jgi:hypothetical protein